MWMASRSSRRRLSTMKIRRKFWGIQSWDDWRLACRFLGKYPIRMVGSWSLFLSKGQEMKTAWIILWYMRARLCCIVLRECSVSWRGHICPQIALFLLHPQLFTPAWVRTLSAWMSEPLNFSARIVFSLTSNQHLLAFESYAYLLQSIFDLCIRIYWLQGIFKQCILILRLVFCGYG